MRRTVALRQPRAISTESIAFSARCRVRVSYAYPRRIIVFVGRISARSEGDPQRRGDLRLEVLVTSMKPLIVIPIIHNAADLGSLADAVRSHYVHHLGPQVWNEQELMVTKLWEDIGKSVARLSLDLAHTQIYQDGLPICGHELEIVRELAAAGSLNHQLILRLVEQGAMLMGTEDPQLLIQEYQMHCRRLSLAASDDGSMSDMISQAAKLLIARDQFIARRIAETLQESATGLLFLGAAHRLDTREMPGVQARGLDVAASDAQ